MILTKATGHPAMPTPPDWFQGDVTAHRLSTPDPQAQVALVTFAAGARTAWHTHPLGQLLIVTAGTCLAQTWGGEVTRLSPGDTVWFAPGEKHWHGAAPDGPMTHIAVHEAEGGRTVDWLEPVT